MAAPNPYLIYIELFLSDGVTRPNQNQIARVNAYDVNGAVVTWEGQSGYNPGTGGWQPVYMQNIAAFSPPRDQPNLKFEVVNTAEAIVHTTQVFSNIPNQSTVRITIGVGAVLVGGGGTPSWQVSGKVQRENGSAISPGTVIVYDVTNGSVAQLGTATLASDGAYSLTYAQSAFANNGVPHSAPNLQIKAFDTLGQLLAESAIVMGAASTQVINLTVPDSAPGTTQYRVFGNVMNTLSLPVFGIKVEAYHVGWTATGLVETALGNVTSGTAGAYEILYAPPMTSGANPCATPAGDVNLIVYAKDATTSAVLFASPVIFDARREERVDPKVDRISTGADSEYQRLDTAIRNCLGTTDAERFVTLGKLDTRPELLKFVAQSSGQDASLIRAYVSAWLIAAEINAKIPVGPTGLSRLMAPALIYGLLRVLRRASLQGLLNVMPDEFFDAVVRAVHQGIVPASLETDLFPSAVYGNKSLLDDWRVVLSKLMNAVAPAGQQGAWQAPLLALVFPGATAFPQVSSQTETLFATDVTTHNVVMPSGIVAGDLLIVLFTNDGSATVTAPVEWNQLFTAANGAVVRLSAFVKIAAGTESGTNVNLTTSAVEQASAQIHVIAKDRWTGNLSDVVAATTATTGNSVNVDPPNLAPSWASSKTLWLACAGHDREFGLSSSPSNYTNSQRSNSSATTSSVTALSARRELASASENPGAFVIATAKEWVAQTIAIKPSPTIVPSSKAEAVVSAYFDFEGQLQPALASLVAASTITATESESVTFVFEMYETVSRYYPIVASTYQRKSFMGWKTTRDLATVPVQATSGTDHWYAYALNSQSYSSGTFPADIQGSGPDEKALVYARRLQALFGGIGQQQMFAADLALASTTDSTLVPVKNFLATNSTFSLENTNLDRFLTDKGITLPDADKLKIKQVQRVYRVAPTFSAASALITAGLDSVVKIAGMNEGAFIAQHEKNLGGLTAAQNVFRTAAHYATEIFSTLVKYHHNLNDLGGLSAIPGPVDFTVLDPTEGLLPNGAITPGGVTGTTKFPNWVTLFGDLNQCACKHCQTVLSPGAYLVDLIEFCDGTQQKTLFNRRPDLVDIELTCTNTETMLPYIDLVNEVLEGLVKPLVSVLTFTSPDTVPGVLGSAATGSATAITKVRTALNSAGFVLADQTIVSASAVAGEWVIVDEAWRFVVRQVSSTWYLYATPQTSSTNDSLEVFPEHFNKGAYDLLAQAIFPFNLPLELGREEIEIFLKARNVRPHEVREAFSLLSPESKLKNETIALAYLKLTSNEAGAILGEGHPAREFWGFSSDSATIPPPDKPTETVTGDWKNLLSLMPIFLHRSGLRYEDLLELLDTDFVQREAANIHGVHVAADTAQLVQCNLNAFQIAHLNQATLLRMSFFLRLWRKLGWTMREVDRYLVALEAGNLPLADPEGTTFASKLVRLSLLKRLADELRLSPRTVAAFWTPIDSRRTPRHKKSLFDDVFLHGDVTQPEIRDLEKVARGGTFNLDTQEPDEDIKNHVRMALRLRALDIDQLWETFIGTGSGLTLTLSKLTDLYRVASLCAVLKLSVADYFDLSKVVDKTALPTGTPLNLRTAMLATHAAVREFRIARAVKIPAAELLYLLTDQFDEADPFVPTRQDLDRAVQRLAASASEIAEANPEQPNPDAVVLSTALAKVLPPDKVVRAVTLIEEGAVNADNQTFVDRYFAVFLGSATATFLASLAALGDDAPARRALGWAPLHAFLLERARTTAAVTVAAELAGTDEDIANTLLTQSLSSLFVPALANALEDWKRLASGGFSRGAAGANVLEGTIEPVIDDGAAGKRLATLVVPKGAEYRFVASIASTSVSGTPVAFYIDLDDGRTALTAGPATVVGDRTEFVFEPVTLRGGSVHDIEFNFTATGSATVSFLWRIDNADAVLVPRTAVVPFAETIYKKLTKAARLVRGLSLKKPELEQLILVEVSSVSLPDALPVSSGDPRLPWASLSTFLEILDLQRSVRLNTTTLFELWRDHPELAAAAVANPTNPNVVLVAAQTDWRPDDIVSVLGLWSGTKPAWNNPALWLILRGCFTIIRRLDTRAALIQDRLVAKLPSLSIAATLRNLFRAQFTPETWKDVFKPLRDPLRRRQRDALIGYLTTRPIANPTGGAALNFFDPNDLFSFLLIDVEMEPDTLISRIKLALNTIQLFVHRVFLGLEDPRVFAVYDDAKDQWTWMERFRVWEANRKVFLFPENYIEPELRDDKTEFFKQFEDELSQGTLTHETATAALASYLDKMKEVSDLEVVGSFSENAASGANFTLHVVGRTRTQARAFFYRKFEARPGHDGFWDPWEEIPLDITADVVIPVVVDGRLRLFWPKVVTREKQRPGGGDTEDIPHAEYVAQIRLTWSEYLPKKKKWSKPKVSKSQAKDFNAAGPFQREIGQDQPQTDNYHFRARFEPDALRIDAYRTNVPTSAYSSVIRTRTTVHEESTFFGGSRTVTTVEPQEVPVAASLDPLLLGAFRFAQNGDDQFYEYNVPLALPAAEYTVTSVEGTPAQPVWFGSREVDLTTVTETAGPIVSSTTGLGANYPVGTVLKANAAVEVSFPVNTLVSNDQLEFLNAVPFLTRTPGTPFRLFETNFGYVPGAALEPFFYETNIRSLFALVKPPVIEPPPPGVGSGKLFEAIADIIAALTQQLVRRVTFSTFHHPLVQDFEKRLHDYGVEGLMNRLTQALPYVDDQYYYNYYYNYYGSLYLGYHIARDDQAWGTTQRMFEAETVPDTRTVAPYYPLPTVEFGYGTPFGVYNWELFFHAPMLVAERMKQDFKFEDAMRWYHYVFDPKQTLNSYERTRRFVDSLPKGSRYWNFLPFFANRDATDSLLETLGLKGTVTPYEREQLSKLIDEWKRNPFRPHLIARSRTVAYQKNVVMKYLDNLIAWADDLFRQDTFETINEATQLYILADEILGQAPDHVEPLTGSPRHTYRELKARGLDAFSNAISEVESLLVTNRPHFRSLNTFNSLPALSSGMQLAQSVAKRSFFFRIPRNERLDKYWSVVQDRLFKIRNSMNIDGVKRQLALFEPPIDPALLVRAVAAGLDLGSVLSQLNTPLPHYRFNVWVQKATELTKEVQSFGAAFLAALEKRDGEDLSLLRQAHEIRMLELVRAVRKQQIAEAEGNIKALERSRELAEERFEEYRRRSRVSAQEQSQIDKTKTANIYDIASGAAHTLAALLAIIPDSSVGTNGFEPVTRAHIPIGTALSQIATAAADVAGTLATVNRNEATLAGLRAGHDRRWEDWKLQERQAQKEMVQIDQQIVVANIRLSIAEKELDNHEAQLEQAQEMRDFLKDKFTSRELYHWMVGELSRTYQTVYKLAFNAAKTAERTFGFELGVEDPAFIQFDYRDSLREGLLAGEKLLVDLKRLEVAYLERNKRELEIQKSISLAVINGEALQDLREKGFCEFELPEVLFDLDFPGQYFRRIKAVRMTIPCVTGPHTSVSAMLSLIGSNFRKDATIASADDYPYQGADDSRFAHDPVGIQSIATGTAQGDAGLFEFNFRDERYLPFEGAGAISRWRLELPDATRQFNYTTISDVVLQMSYTARPAGGLLKDGAEQAVLEGLNRLLEIRAGDGEPTGLVRALSLKKELPDVFHRLLSTPNSPVAMTLEPEHFPYVLRNAGFDLALKNSDVMSLHLVVKKGTDLGGAVPEFSITANGASSAGTTPLSDFDDNGVSITDLNVGAVELVPGFAPQDFTLVQTGLTLDLVEDLVLVANYTVDQA